jgi:hypothetical protein
MDLSGNQSDWLTVAARRWTAESLGGTWWSEMNPMRLVSAARALSSPKVSSSIVTRSRRGLEEEELKRTEQGDLAEAKTTPKEFGEDARKNEIT